MNKILNVDSGTIAFAAMRIYNYNCEINDYLNVELHKRVEELDGKWESPAKNKAVYKFNCICADLLGRRYNEIDNAVIHLRDKVAVGMNETEEKILNNLVKMFNP